MNAAPWWKHAVVYRADPHSFGGMHALAEHLNYVRSLGADALLLTSLGGSDSQPMDPSLGTVDDLDEIIRRASQDNLRVLVELDSSSAGAEGKARLWLTHGVAGFYAPKATPDRLAEIRRSAAGFGGQRIVIGDVDASAQSHGPDTPQLVADARAGTQEKLAAASLRPALEAAQQIVEEGHSIPLLLSDGPGLKRSFSRYGDGTHDLEIAKQLAAMLMTTRARTMIFSGQELGLSDGSNQISFAEPKKGEQPNPLGVVAESAAPSSLLNWYRQLSALSHTNRTLSNGAITILNHDEQNLLAWVRRPAAASLATPPIVVVENLSAQPVTVSLKADIQRLHLRGSFLRTLLRSDGGMGTMHLDGMALAPHSVFIGELRY
jgi:glycosidase